MVLPLMQFQAEVRIELKPGVADPEGANTKKTLALLGFAQVADVKATRSFKITLDAEDAHAARLSVGEMCKRLLVNPVVHEAHITITPLAAPAV